MADHKMNHYFSQTEPERSDPKSFRYSFGSYVYTFTTDTGVFSDGKMNPATDIFIRNIPPLTGSLLDMGCGCGVLGIVLAKEYNLTLTQADINPRAVRLTADNAAQNGVTSHVLQSDMFAAIDKQFNTIVINPPIHAGKDVVFAMYDHAKAHLVTPDGALYIVILKKHGAESSIKRLNEIFGNCETLYKKKGVHVIKSSL